MNILEKQIEDYIRRKVEYTGGKFLKWVSPGNDGVPDRIAIFPDGKIWFVELKTKRGKIAPIQQYWNERLRELHCNAIFIVGEDEAKAWCEERIKEYGKRAKA